jgi:hypothetical protein
LTAPGHITAARVALEVGLHHRRLVKVAVEERGLAQRRLEVVMGVVGERDSGIDVVAPRHTPIRLDIADLARRGEIGNRLTTRLEILIQRLRVSGRSVWIVVVDVGMSTLQDNDDSRLATIKAEQHQHQQIVYTEET